MALQEPQKERAAARTHFDAFRSEGLSSAGSPGFTPVDPLDEAQAAARTQI